MNIAPSPESIATKGRWTAALAGDAGALQELAGNYWYCIYAWWRRAGLEADGAATATLACFTRWLDGAAPRAEDSGGERMRQWLPARLAELSASGVEMEGAPTIAIDPVW